MTPRALSVELPSGPPVLTPKAATSLWRLLQSVADAHQVPLAPDATEGPHAQALSRISPSSSQATTATKEIPYDAKTTG